MPKTSKFPKLRTRFYRGKGGQGYTYYFYDRRAEGKGEIALGSDYQEALAKWEELHHHKPRVVGRVQEAVDRWVERELPKYENKETRDSYSKQIKNIAAVFGQMLWDEVTLPQMREYLDRRTVKQKSGDKSPPRQAKTQGNREMSVFSIVWSKARLWGMTRLPWPAAGMKNWKNQENARHFEVTDTLFEAVYEEANQMLRDCMDISTATGMRLTDCRTVALPADNILRLKASKTGKSADFDMSLSNVLPELVARRRAYPACHTYLLSTPDGFPVSVSMLRTAYENAREAAALNPSNLAIAEDLQQMYLRDMRKRASDLAMDDEAASKLLQHSSVAITNKHYRKKVSRISPVR